MSEGDTMTESPITYKGAVRLSKVKYQELEKMFKEELTEDNFDRIMKRFRDILKFDPNCSTYNPADLQKYKDYRVKKAEELGTSTYKALKLDVYYQKRKQKKIEGQNP